VWKRERSNSPNVFRLTAVFLEKTLSKLHATAFPKQFATLAASARVNLTPYA
jgi:hypothetical protein